MKKITYFIAVALPIFTACTKNEDPSPAKTSPVTIDGYTIAQVDSIAKHYGFKLSKNTSTLKNGIVSVNDFIRIMEARKLSGSEINARAGQIYNDNVETHGWNAPYTQHPVYSFTFNFPNFKSAAYPSIYTVTWILYRNWESGSVQPSLLGASFDYNSIDGPIASTTWAYNNHGGMIDGFTNNFNVTNIGVETEVISIIGHTLTNSYRVEFNIAHQSLEMGAYVNATIRMIQLN